MKMLNAFEEEKDHSFAEDQDYKALKGKRISKDRVSKEKYKKFEFGDYSYSD